MENQTHTVTILGVKGGYSVDPPTLKNVRPGDKVEFYSKNAEAKIGFPDSGIINITGWVTIKKGGDPFETIVEDSVDNGTYYYAVMCKHDDNIYWYAEGNSCPAMLVG